MKKRILAIALIAMLLLAGCGKEKEEPAAPAAPVSTQTPAAETPAPAEGTMPDASVPTAEPSPEVMPTTTVTPAPSPTPTPKPVCLHTHSTYSVVTAPTCTDSGRAHYVCSDCGAELSDTVISALGHSYGYQSNQSSHWLLCARCGETTVTFAHSFNSQHICNVCGYGCTHSFTAKVTAPTCTAEGYTTHTCKYCGYTYTDAATEATGHRYAASVVSKPTCTAAGKTKYTCSACKDSFTVDTPALGHTAVTDAAVAATCQHTGLTEGSHCSVCSAVIVAQRTVPALEHRAVTDAAVAATCQHTGLTEGSHCSVCGTVIVAQRTVPALAHEYENGVCKHCGAVDPYYIPPGEYELPEDEF